MNKAIKIDHEINQKEEDNKINKHSSVNYDKNDKHLRIQPIMEKDEMFEEDNGNYENKEDDFADIGYIQRDNHIDLMGIARRKQTQDEVSLEDQFNLMNGTSSNRTNKRKQVKIKRIEKKNTIELKMNVSRGF